MDNTSKGILIRYPVGFKLSKIRMEISDFGSQQVKGIFLYTLQRFLKRGIKG